MERWDQLYTGGYRFCFGDGAFKPSTDTFLLGGFAQVRRGERVCDLGAGIGLPGLMLLSREPEVHITDIDIDEALSMNKGLDMEEWAVLEAMTGL